MVGPGEGRGDAAATSLAVRGLRYTERQQQHCSTDRHSYLPPSYRLTTKCQDDFTTFNSHRKYNTNLSTFIILIIVEEKHFVLSTLSVYAVITKSIQGKQSIKVDVFIDVKARLGYKMFVLQL